MHIDWATLAAVAIVAAAAALTIVLLVSFAVVALPRPARRAGGPDSGGASGAHDAVGAAIATLCLVAAGLVVCCGLYVIVV